MRKWVTIGASAALLAGIIASVVAGIAFAREVKYAQAELTSAKRLISQASTLLADKHSERLQEIVAETQRHTENARETVRGPLWQIAAAVPFIGVNVSAVQSTVDAVDVLARDALPPGLSLMATLRPGKVRLEGGGFDLEPFADAQDSLPDITAAFDTASTIVNDIDRSTILPVVDDVIGEVLDLIATATPALETVERVLPTLLTMAGDDGPRNYLLIFQNLAEIRATGGNPAATAMLRVDEGKITLDRQANSQTFINQGTVGVDYSGWSAETKGIYEEDTTAFSQNYTRTPHFPTTAAMFSGVWAATTGVELDGVISLDPVALSHLLEVAGPVVVDDVELTSENVVQAVLSDAYERYPNPNKSDKFFATAAAKIFARVVSGKWEPIPMLDALTRSAEEQRLYAWFPREAEQELAIEAGIDGRLAVDNEKTTQTGIFINDWTVGKLQYWFRSAVTVTCDVDARTMTTSITMSNTIPNDDFVDYVLGLRGKFTDMPDTTMLLNVLYFAPPGSPVDSVDAAQGRIARYDRAGTEQGRAVKSIMVAVPMGESRTVSYTSTLPDTPLGPLSVRTTPTVTDTPITIADSCTALSGAPSAP